jgi:hypothetical protein
MCRRIGSQTTRRNGPVVPPMAHGSTAGFASGLEEQADLITQGTVSDQVKRNQSRLREGSSDASKLSTPPYHVFRNRTSRSAANLRRGGLLLMSRLVGRLGLWDMDQCHEWPHWQAAGPAHANGSPPIRMHVLRHILQSHPLSISGNATYHGLPGRTRLLPRQPASAALRRHLQLLWLGNVSNVSGKLLVARRSRRLYAPAVTAPRQAKLPVAPLRRHLRSGSLTANVFGGAASASSGLSP